MILLTKTNRANERITYDCRDGVFHEGAWVSKKRIHDFNASLALVIIVSKDCTILIVPFDTIPRFSKTPAYSSVWAPVK